MNRFHIGPFLGIASFADPRLIGENYAQDSLNVRGSEGGWIEPRYGYQKLSSGTIPTGFSASYRMDYIEGYDGSYANQQEYPLVETVSGNTYPYVANPTTGARTELKNGASHLSLTASDWHWFSYNGYGYGVNKNATYPIIRYTMGTTNTIANVNVAADPTTLETYVVPLPNATTYPSNPGNYKQIVWTNAVNTTDITYTGLCTSGRTGTASSGSSTTLVDSGKTWVTNEFACSVEVMTITITGGTGVGSNAYPILSNTGTTITVASWAHGTPDNTSTYRINTSAASVASPGSYLIENETESLNQGAGSFTIDFTSISGLGVQDFTNNDKFQLIIFPYDLGTGYSNIDPGTYSVTLISSAGTTYTPQLDRDTQNTQVAIEGTNRVVPFTILTLSFDGSTAAKPVRSAWSTIKKMTVSYSVIGHSTSGAKGDRVMIRPLIVGGVNNVPPNPKPASLIATTSRLSFGYAYKSSTTNFESGIGGIITVPFAPDLSGLATQYATTRKLGSNLTLKGTVSADGTVDSVNFYVRDDSDVWRLIGSSSNTGTPSVTYALTWTEVLALTAYAGSSGTFPYTGIKRGIPVAGYVLWLCEGGQSNLKFSAIGNPLRIYNANTDASSADATRPANFTLADNFGDEPLNAFQCDTSIVITGNQGVYAMTRGAFAFATDAGWGVADGPSTLSPPKRLPGTQGCAGEDAACRWHDELGNPGVAWMSKDGEVWFSLVSNVFDGAVGHRTVHVSAGIQGLAKSWLWDGQSLSDLSGTMFGVDEAADALWIVNKARALILTRPSLLDGSRQWLKYSYTGMSIKSLAFSQARRLRAIMTTGEIIELEYDSSNAYAPITGATRDMGSSMPAPYWTSKIFRDTRWNKRLNAVRVQRDTTTDLTTVTAYTTKSPSGVSNTLASGQSRMRFPPTVTGPESYYKITLDGTMGKVRDLVLEEAAAGERVKA